MDLSITSDIPTYVSIGIVVTVVMVNAVLLHCTDKNDDVISTAFKYIGLCVGFLLTSFYKLFSYFILQIAFNYWIPVIIIVVTWGLFPEIIEDLVFLIYLGFRKYKALLF